MEKKIIILTIFFTVLFSANTSNATSETELIDSQVEELQINSLIADIEKVTLKKKGVSIQISMEDFTKQWKAVEES